MKQGCRALVPDMAAAVMDPVTVIKAKVADRAMGVDVMAPAIVTVARVADGNLIFDIGFRISGFENMTRTSGDEVAFCPWKLTCTKQDKILKNDNIKPAFHVLFFSIDNNRIYIPNPGACRRISQGDSDICRSAEGRGSDPAF